MLKTDINEIKNRLKKGKCFPSKVSGCIVSTNKEILATFHTFFGNLEEGDQIMYLDIANRVLKGTKDNNTLQLDFPNEAEYAGGAQHLLVVLRDSDFEDDEAKNALFNKIIANYAVDSEYVIFLFHDVYDVMNKTTDGIKLDESSSVFDYMICAVCPLEETRPGLIYSHSEQVIKERIRDWIITEPEVGFMFPAFIERESDVHSVLYHIKSPENTHEDFVEGVLGCTMIQTSEDKKIAFSDILNKVLEDKEENVGRIIYGINESLRDKIEIKKDVQDAETGEVTGTRTAKEDIEVNNAVIKEVLEENDVAEEKIEAVQQAFKEEIQGTTSVDQIIDRKLLVKEKFQRREEELLLEIAELREENLSLKEKLKELGAEV